MIPKSSNSTTARFTVRSLKPEASAMVAIFGQQLRCSGLFGSFLLTRR
jgi:hypothetical protein